MKRTVWMRTRDGLGTLARRRRSRNGRPGETLAKLWSLEDVERAHVQRVLAESTNLRAAANRLGIDPTTLWRKRKRWGLA
jgi:NtrC-family two-component system response regulator AlgB